MTALQRAVPTLADGSGPPLSAERLQELLEAFPTVAVRAAVGLQRQREELLLGRRQTCGLAFLVDPAGGLVAVMLDLARQLVADGLPFGLRELVDVAHTLKQVVCVKG